MNQSGINTWQNWHKIKLAAETIKTYNNLLHTSLTKLVTWYNVIKFPKTTGVTWNWLSNLKLLEKSNVHINKGLAYVAIGAPLGLPVVDDEFRCP
jgi:hypothetical protein